MSTIKRLFLFAVLSLCVPSLHAQYSIKFNIDNYENDTLVVGNYLMDKQLVVDTLYATSQGQFVLEDSLATGVYIVLTLPDNNFLQFMVNDFEKEFEMNFDYEDRRKVEFVGSEDNAAFQSLVEYMNVKRPQADSLRLEIDRITAAGGDISSMQKQLDAINDDIAHRQDSLIENKPEYLSSLLLRANKEIKMPEFGETEEERLKQYRFYKSHYFDHIDLTHPATLRTPFLFHRVNYYLDKLTPAHPDSLAMSLDTILQAMQPNEETFMYYLSHYLNKYAQAKIVGHDAVYVYLAENYYGAGLATWAKEENVAKIMDRSNRLKPILIGKNGPDIKVFGEDGTPISISEIDYEYLILLFWAPNCGHCKKSMPDFIEFNEKYKDKGIKTFAICTKYREKVKDCWEYVKEKDMLGFINGADEFNQSNFKLLYNVDSTPKIFILDKDRKIIMKNIGASQLERVFEEVIGFDLGTSENEESEPMPDK